MEPDSVLSFSERSFRMERILEISRMMSESLELEATLQSIIKAASDLTSCEIASILEMDRNRGQLHFLSVPPIHHQKLSSAKIPVYESVAGWVIENEQPVVIPDVEMEPRHFKGTDQITGFTTRSLMAVPIIFGGEKFGVLEVINKQGEAHYTEDDLTILEMLSSFAAIAIQNSRLTDQINKSQEQNLQLDDMKDDFIAIASHELRTPLGLILGHATFLRETVEGEITPQLDVIVRNAIRLKDIIDNFSNIDNAQRGMASLRANVTSIKKVIDEMMDAFSREAKEKQISLRADIGKGDLLVEGDNSKISIALTNVVRNALDFTKAGGHIVIKGEEIPGYVKLSVIDDGVGISSKDLPHIFERFYQAENHLTRKHAGMGLGLSIAKVMIELHGGQISAESVEGKGSKFTLLLPVIPIRVDSTNPKVVS
jgi:signal transduction histidine kinase